MTHPRSIEEHFEFAQSAGLGRNMATMIRALQTQGVLRELQEPNLIAMDGQQASFLAGGEFPVPIAQVAVIKAPLHHFQRVWRAAEFKPTIIDETTTSGWNWNPKFRQLDFANGVEVRRILNPALEDLAGCERQCAELR